MAGSGICRVAGDLCHCQLVTDPGDSGRRQHLCPASGSILQKGRNGQNDIQGGCYQLFIPDRHRIVLCILSYDGGR